MNAIDISRETIVQLARSKGIRDICEYALTCRDKDNKSRRDYTLTIEGIDCALKKKKLFFELTEWEELVDGDNQTKK